MNNCIYKIQKAVMKTVKGLTNKYVSCFPYFKEFFFDAVWKSKTKAKDEIYDAAVAMLDSAYLAEVSGVVSDK